MRSCLETVLEAVSNKQVGKYGSAKSIKCTPSGDIRLQDVLEILEYDGFKVRSLRRFEHPEFREVLGNTFSDGTTSVRLFIGLNGYNLTFDSAGILYLLAIGKCTLYRKKSGKSIGITNVYYDEYSDSTLMDGIGKLNRDLESI